VGYTHYVTQPRDFTKAEWLEVRSDISCILNDVMHVQDIALANSMGECGTQPEITDDMIMFNGLAPNDDHESMVIERKRPQLEEWQKRDRRGWSFCKTAAKPYDLAVVACLAYLESIHGWIVTSDGRGHEWLAGVEEARRALPKYANQIDIPLSIRKKDRWSWKAERDAGIGTNHAKSIEIGFCIDGRAYVYDARDETQSYCFPTHAEAAAWFAQLKEPHAIRHGDNGWPISCGGPLFNATGAFDRLRRENLERAHRKVLQELLNAAVREKRNIAPPAFARPRAMPKVAKDQPTLDSLFDLVT
jgi:hypothetical protein